MSSTQPQIFYSPPPRPREILIFTTFYFGPARASRILGGRVREGCNVGVGNQWVINGALVALLSSSGVAQKAAYPGTMPLDVIVQSIQKAQAAVRPQSSYQIIREYRLSGTKDSKADSEVVAEVDFKPPASERYTIQRYSGSGRGQQLVRSILDHEVEITSKDKDKGRSAISGDNYIFNYIGEGALDGQSCYVLGLKPKRTDKDLVSGQVWVDKHSFLIRQIQGDVEKTPSWWLKKVRITLVFADLEGTWVQKSMEAVADVRLVGTHTLTSRILDYRRENEVAATPFPMNVEKR
jgi:hypothetical protein